MRVDDSVNAWVGVTLCLDDSVDVCVGADDSVDAWVGADDSVDVWVGADDSVYGGTAGETGNSLWREWTTQPTAPSHTAGERCHTAAGDTGNSPMERVDDTANCPTHTMNSCSILI